MLAPPNPTWQARASEWAERCGQALWSPAGERALAWLHGRGLGDEILRGFGIGYNDADVYEEHALWGLEAPDQGVNKGAAKVWLARGITIPWRVSGGLWRLNVRRPLSARQLAGGEAKYIGPAGFANALYNGDALATARAAVIVEGEFDALTVVQACADLTGGEVAAVATGSTAGARRFAWVAALAAVSRVLVAFDRDEAGERAAAWWLHVLPNAQRLLPRGHDANTLPAPDLVRAWVAEGLGAGGPVCSITNLISQEASL